MHTFITNAYSHYLIALSDGSSFKSDGPTQISTQHYVLLGDSLSLVCGRGLDSNPQATITWIATDGATVIDSARFELENGPEIVRLNFTYADRSDYGVWTCEINVTSERHTVNNDGKLISKGEAVIGSPIRHKFLVIIISEFQLNVIRPMYVNLRN